LYTQENILSMRKVSIYSIFSASRVYSVFILLVVNHYGITSFWNYQVSLFYLNFYFENTRNLTQHLKKQHFNLAYAPHANLHVRWLTINIYYCCTGPQLRGSNRAIASSRKFQKYVWLSVQPLRTCCCTTTGEEFPAHFFASETKYPNVKEIINWTDGDWSIHHTMQH